MSRLRRLRKSLTQFPDIEPPSSWLLAAEVRAAGELLAGLMMHLPVKHMSARGDGHPVLVIPGLGASDRSMALMRKFLGSLGYQTYDWEMGRNRGFRHETQVALQQRLHTIYNQQKQKVSVIGQSLGGVYARELAKAAPAQIRQVITLGAPFSGHPLATSGIRLYEWLSGEKIEDLDFERHHAICSTPPVPTTSVYSKLDGIVAWQCSIERGVHQTENVHLRGASHCGMACSPAAMYLLADRLAHKPDHWKPFAPRGVARALFGVDDHHGALVN